ncbi:hypothetical protein NMG60_11022839 [Bertholletia excelsa]
MVDNEEVGENIPRGNEWEVVSLTASAYASAPSPRQVELNDIGREDTGGEDEAESSRALFMSGHFVFPPTQHENLPLEPENIEIQNIQGIEDDVSETGALEVVGSVTKDEEDWSIKRLAMSDDLPGIQFFDEKGNRLSGELNEAPILQGLIEKEQSMYSASKPSSFHSETTMDGPATCDNDRATAAKIEPSEGGSDSAISQLSEPASQDKYDSSVIPCEAWWKRQASSLYAQAKEANAVWSVFIAAAVMGLAILGQRWQQERWQVLQLNWKFSINDEKMGRMLGPISRFKDIIVGGNQRSSLRSSSSVDH